MSIDDNEVTPEFVEHQRDRLEELRDQFMHDVNEAEAEERDLSQRHGDEVQDTGDEGAIELQRGNAELLSAEDTSRLDDIERALEKIAEDSYGVSDDSGEPIPRARLEALPEARFTLEEQERREQELNI